MLAFRADEGRRCEARDAPQTQEQVTWDGSGSLPLAADVLGDCGFVDVCIRVFPNGRLGVLSGAAGGHCGGAERERGGDRQQDGVAGQVRVEREQIGGREAEIGQGVISRGQTCERILAGEALDLDEPGDEAQAVGAAEHDPARHQQPDLLSLGGHRRKRETTNEHHQPDNAGTIALCVRLQPPRQRLDQHPSQRGQRGDRGRYGDALGGVLGANDARQ